MFKRKKKASGEISDKSAQEHQALVREDKKRQWMDYQIARYKNKEIDNKDLERGYADESRMERIKKAFLKLTSRGRRKLEEKEIQKEGDRDLEAAVTRRSQWRREEGDEAGEIPQNPFAKKRRRWGKGAGAAAQNPGGEAGDTTLRAHKYSGLGKEKHPAWQSAEERRNAQKKKKEDEKKAKKEAKRTQKENAALERRKQKVLADRTKQRKKNGESPVADGNQKPELDLFGNEILDDAEMEKALAEAEAEKKGRKPQKQEKPAGMDPGMFMPMQYGGDQFGLGGAPQAEPEKKHKRRDKDKKAAPEFGDFMMPLDDSALNIAMPINFDPDNIMMPEEVVPEVKEEPVVEEKQPRKKRKKRIAKIDMEQEEREIQEILAEVVPDYPLDAPISDALPDVHHNSSPSSSVPVATKKRRKRKKVIEESEKSSSSDDIPVFKPVRKKRKRRSISSESGYNKDRDFVQQTKEFYDKLLAKFNEYTK